MAAWLCCPLAIISAALVLRLLTSMRSHFIFSSRYLSFSSWLRFSDSVFCSIEYSSSEVSTLSTLLFNWWICSKKPAHLNLVELYYLILLDLIPFKSFHLIYLDTVSSRLAEVSIIFEAKIPHSSFSLSTVEFIRSWPAGAVLANTTCASSTVFCT